MNYDAGMSVAVTINGSQVNTRFAVNANQFVVINGSGNNVYSPFVIKDGQVLISQAFIGTAWIGRGNITDVLQSDNYVQNQVGLSINFKTVLLKTMAPFLAKESINKQIPEYQYCLLMVRWFRLGV